MKRFLAILMALTMITLSACSRGVDSGSAEEVKMEGDFKVGIITGTVSQGEEEFQAAQNMIKKYGPDKIITATYPDKFNDEVETTISQVVSLAEDGAKAILICQAVPGSIAAIEKVKETHPEILFLTGVVQETPAEVAAVSDICMLVDEIGMGRTVVEQAQKQGATTFVHYSFPRHLGMETIARRREIFQATCKELGIEYVDVNAPDPTGDAGVSGAQQFILEDVPRQVETYGVETSIFSTNCSMQEPLIRSVIEQGAIFSQQCCPSPYHGLPAALNIETKGHEGDIEYVKAAIGEKVVAAGASGRVSTWPIPVNMLMVEVGTDYAIRWCEGEFEDRHDDAEFRKSISTVAAEYDANVALSLYEEDGEELNNFYMILCDYYNF